ncbi:hypothetical protein JL721_11264 [Aureococcus anophagefferens]|nr:hypothetical protein JL721_11264 [Aureococcus anophagefferens]
MLRHLKKFTIYGSVIVASSFDDGDFQGAVDEWIVDSTGAQIYYGAISDWDVSKVTSMEATFEAAGAFNADIGGWDVSKVTDMARIFYHASTFNADIGAWDVSSVTTMYYAFRGAATFEADIGAWDVSAVTSMNGAFSFAEDFNADISDWDVSKASTTRARSRSSSRPAPGAAASTTRQPSTSVDAAIAAAAEDAGLAAAFSAISTASLSAPAVATIDAPTPKPTDAPTAKLTAGPTTAPTNLSLDAGEFGEGDGSFTEVAERGCSKHTKKVRCNRKRKLHETAMAEDAPPRVANAFRVANALEAASGRPIGSPAPRAAFFVDAAAADARDDGATRLWPVWIPNLQPDFNRRRARGLLRRAARAYATDDALGRRLYGPTSERGLVREHLYGAADRSCDHWHDDLGILNHHVGITWQLEKALRSVDGTTAPTTGTRRGRYGRGRRVGASAIFGADWFGAASPGRDDHVLDAGAWAYTPVRSNARPTAAPRRLRSPAEPWNTSAVPFLARHRYVLGNDGGGFALPSCADFVPFLNDPAVSLGSIASGLNGGLHGPVHIMVGGHWGFDEAKWASYLADYAPFSPSQVLLFSKFAWRTGFVTCPPTRSRRAPRRAAATDGGAFFGAHGLSASDILDLVCAVGYPGELFTSAAPQDPLFWPLHGLAERFLQYARVLDALGAIGLDEAWRYKHRKNVASDTGVVCDWSTGSPAAPLTCRATARTICCPSRPLPGQVGLVSNRDFTTARRPSTATSDAHTPTTGRAARGPPPASDDDDRGPPA